MVKWVCHCNVEAFDGVSNIRSKPTELVEATSEKQAITNVKKLIEKRYKEYGCKINHISIALIKCVSQ